jgi:uncharacterized protein (TIGR02596 family)
MITPLQKQMRKRGFTLIELLMVMAIMLVIMGLVVVAFPGLGKASNLTNGAQSFVDLLNQARQNALTTNRNVEVRFYYLPGPTDGTTATAYRGMRIITCDAYGQTNDPVTTTIFSLGAKPSPMQRLPAGIIIYSGTAVNASGKYFTTLLPSMTSSTNPVATWPASYSSVGMKPYTGTAATNTAEVLPGAIGGTTPVAYAAFQFKPNGGTNLDPNKSIGDAWFMTFKIETDTAPNNTKPANNFVTVVLDPLTGRVKLFRP